MPSKSYIDSLSEKDIRSILYNMSNDDICNAAICANNEEIFDNTYTNLGTVDYSCVIKCTDKNIIEKIVGKISDVLANELFMELIEEKDVTNELLFDALIRSGRVHIDLHLFSELVKNDHVHGMKYFLRNGFNNITTKIFQIALINRSIGAMDVLFPHITISGIEIDEFIKKKYVNKKAVCVKKVLDRLREYGYDLFGKFLALKRIEKDKVTREIYAYIHDHGVYYDRVILRKMKVIYASNKTYWRIPEKDRQLFLNKLSETTHELREIPYAKKMIVNDKTDMIIVCQLD